MPTTRRFAPLALFAAACTGGDGPPPADTAVVGPGWTLGPEHPCPLPQAAPSWVDTSGVTTDYAGTDGGPDLGGIALVEAGGTPWLVWGRPDAPPLARDLTTGTEVELTDLHWAGAFAVADLDADGALDLIGSSNPRVLWGAFGDDPQVSEIPAADTYAPGDIGIADFDADGDLDLLYVFQAWDEARPGDSRPVMRTNLGGRTFSEPVGVAGDDARWGMAFDVNILDVNGDGAPDAYLCHDMGALVSPNLLLLNDGAGQLVAAEDSRGLDLTMSCMGTTWADLDADGDLDLMAASSDKNTLVYQEPKGFVDVSFARGIEPTTAPRMGWGAAVVDDENDGYADIFVASSFFATVEERPYDPWWYRQQADGSFADHAADLPTLHDTSTRGVLRPDLNDDGVPDLLVGGLRRSPWVLLSEGCTAGSWLEVRAPSGSYVEVRAGDRTRAGWVTTESGWGSAGPAAARFGLGDTETFDRVTIRAAWSEEVVLEGPFAARRTVEWAP